MLGLDASIPLLIASACYLFVAVSTIGFGIGYLTRPNFTIYYSRALSKEWSELGQELQTLILALMRSISGGALASGVGVVLLVVTGLVKGVRWPFFVAPALSYFNLSGALYAAVLIRTRTPGDPPVRVLASAIGIVTVGLVFASL